MAVREPGRYAVKVLTVAGRGRVWNQSGHKLAVTVNGKTLQRTIRKEERIETARTRYFEEWATQFGTVVFDKPGNYSLFLKADKIRKDRPDGIRVSQVRLEPIR